MRSQRATRHHYLGRLILATMATAIAISLGLTAFGTPVPASAAESEVAASGANQSGSAELTNQQKADALKQAADAAEQANDIESATTLRGWANEAQNATGPADITTLSEFPLNPQAQVGGDAQPVGIRSFAFKKALKAVGWMTRKSPNAFIDLTKSFLDDAAETALRRSSGQIADAIDDVAGLPDLAGHIVREKLFYALEGSLGGGTAKVIADSVEWAMWALL